MRDISIRPKAKASASDKCFRVLRAYREGHPVAVLADLFKTTEDDIRFMVNQALKSRIVGGYSVGDATEFSARQARI